MPLRYPDDPSNPPPIANPTAVRHPERGQRPRRSFAEGALQVLTNYSNQPKRADAKPAQRAGIYEGVFVTFQRHSYFSTNAGRRGRRPLRICVNPHGYAPTKQILEKSNPRFDFS